LTPEAIAKRYVPYRHQGADPAWNFQMLVDPSARPGGEQISQSQPGRPLMSLAVLTRANPPCDVEVFGHPLDAEINPADWLDAWLAEARIRPVSARYVRMPSGVVGDVVGTWTTDSTQWIGRFFCLKVGARLFLLCFRASAPDYSRVADDFFVSIASFAAVEQLPGPLAEQLRRVDLSAPIRCRVAVPASWEVKIESTDEGPAAFTADLNLASQSGPILAARLSFAMAGSDLLNGHQEAFAHAMQAVSTAGVSAPPAEPESEPASPPFSESWLSVTSGELGGQKTQVRCRVMHLAAAWCVALVITLDARTSPQGWMRAKRALDIATLTIEFI
jgi:hypothetical protein